LATDALLADLESSTAHISKCPVFLPEETPYSYPTGGHLFQDDSPPPPLPPPPISEALNGSLSPRPDSQHSSQQSLGSAHKSTLSRDSSPPASHTEEDHVYSFPNKQKHSDSSAAAMTSALGSNLSELDRLLLELNAVQQNAPSYSTTDVAPPLPPCSVAHYIQENGAHPGITLTPAAQDKPQRNGTKGTDDGRPTVESLLNELESSVPSPCALTSELTDGQVDTPSEQQGRISATSATRELDELMACLSDFKVPLVPMVSTIFLGLRRCWETLPWLIMAQGKGPQPQVNKLDNMLGSLQSDLHKLGVQTVAKGVCGACCKPIVGQVVTAMGRTWHPEHFVCTHCQEEIGSRNFFEREGQPYCERDYHHLFSPRCNPYLYVAGFVFSVNKASVYYVSLCIHLFSATYIVNKTWHPEHFFCAQCGAFFGFHEKDGKAYCRKDYFDLFAPKCGGCARAILENYISALSALWHPECFVCRECFTPFVNGSFFEHDGQPYCEVHYHSRRGSLCSVLFRLMCLTLDIPT
uniref:Paxillin b n=1 Tax=Sinocyclocheilus anshuiensis TaxID=1608454 RepID=A0A671RNQ6_9TELE